MTIDTNDTSRGRVPWRIRDLLDLEYFLHGEDPGAPDASGPSAAPSPRDIYLSRLRHLADDGTPAARRRLIMGWLDVRREAAGETVPGAIYREVSRICLILGALLGLLGGGGLAATLLHYSGSRPLNVSVYLGVGVFAQLLLLAVLAVVFFYRAASRSLVANSVLAKLLGRMLSGLFLKIRGRAQAQTGGGTRGALAAAAGLFQGRRRVYGSLFFWPVFILIQIFALFFNAGLLGGTLVKLAGSDVAFGWQSTFQVGPAVVYRITETLALPWRGLLPPGVAHPTLEQIEGSRIILKEGIYRLATGDLVSWWPFLCLSVLFYGLLPRLLLLLWGLFYQRYLLARLALDHGACDQLVRRMLTPVVQTDGGPAADREAGGADAEVEAPAPPPPPTGGGKELVALVPEDILDASDGLEEAVAARLGMRVADRKRIGGGPRADRAVLETLGTGEGVLVLQEAWQPPIREMLSFLRALRQHLGDRGRIVVGLIGKPGAATIYTRVREEDFRIWKRGLDALADPYLTVERLGYHE